MKYLSILLSLSLVFSLQTATREDFISAVSQYDHVVATIGQGSKTYDHIPPAAGKISAAVLWAYGALKGLRQGDLYKVAMATLAACMFGLSVAAVSKMVVDGSFYIKHYYALYRIEKKIHEIAHELHLTINDIAQIDTSSFTITTQQMLGELQLDLLLQ